MALNELCGNKLSECTVVPDDKGFVAEVLVNNIRYEGRGTTKIGAKCNASEKALRDLIIQKMVLKPRKTKQDIAGKKKFIIIIKIIVKKECSCFLRECITSINTCPLKL